MVLVSSGTDQPCVQAKEPCALVAAQGRASCSCPLAGLICDGMNVGLHPHSWLVLTELFSRTGVLEPRLTTLLPVGTTGDKQPLGAIEVVSGLFWNMHSLLRDLVLRELPLDALGTGREWVTGTNPAILILRSRDAQLAAA